jgi:hypothetical protein
MAEDVKISLQTTTPEVKVQTNTKATTSNIENSKANIGTLQNLQVYLQALKLM